MMNTRIRYLYDDAAYNKTANEAVIYGELTPAQQEQILDSLNEGERFVPKAVGLPERRNACAPGSGPDHSFFRLYPGFAEPTNDEPDTDISADDLTNAFVDIGPSGWDEYVVKDKVYVHFLSHSGQLTAVFEVENFDEDFVPTLEKAEQDWAKCPIERYWSFIIQQAAAAGYKFTVSKNLIVYTSQYA